MKRLQETWVNLYGASQGFQPHTEGDRQQLEFFADRALATSWGDLCDLAPKVNRKTWMSLLANGVFIGGMILAACGPTRAQEPPTADCGPRVSETDKAIGWMYPSTEVEQYMVGQLQPFRVDLVGGLVEYVPITGVERMTPELPLPENKDGYTAFQSAVLEVGNGQGTIEQWAFGTERGTIETEFIQWVQTPTGEVEAWELGRGPNGEMFAKASPDGGVIVRGTATLGRGNCPTMINLFLPSGEKVRVDFLGQVLDMFDPGGVAEAAENTATATARPSPEATVGTAMTSAPPTETVTPTATKTKTPEPTAIRVSTPDRSNLDEEDRPTALPEAVSLQPTTVTISKENLSSMVLDHYSMRIYSAEHIPGLASIVMSNAAMVSLHVDPGLDAGKSGVEVTALLVYKNRLMRVIPDEIVIGSNYYLLSDATAADVSSILRTFDSVARSPHRQPSVIYGFFSPLRGSQGVCEVAVQFPSVYQLCNSVPEESRPETRNQLKQEFVAQVQALPVLSSRDELVQRVKTEWWKDEAIPLVELETPSDIVIAVE